MILQVFGLGFVSVFDQVLEGLPDGDKSALFSAYIGSLGENGDQYRQVCSWASSIIIASWLLCDRARTVSREAHLSWLMRMQDAEKVEALAKELSGPSELKPDAEGSELQKKLASIAERSSQGNFLYTKFFAIGLFRLLELTGAKDPKALEGLVSAMKIPQESVSRDLMTYKVGAEQRTLQLALWHANCVPLPKEIAHCTPDHVRVRILRRTAWIAGSVVQAECSQGPHE